MDSDSENVTVTHNTWEVMGTEGTVVKKPFIITIILEAVTTHNNDCEKASCLFRLDDEKI